MCRTIRCRWFCVCETAASRQAASNKVTERLNAVLARAKANKDFETESGNRSTCIRSMTTNVPPSRLGRIRLQIRVKKSGFRCAQRSWRRTARKRRCWTGCRSACRRKNMRRQWKKPAKRLCRAFGEAGAEREQVAWFFRATKSCVCSLRSRLKIQPGVGAALYAAAPVEASLKSRAAPVMDTDGGMREVPPGIRGSVQMQ